MAEAHRPRVLVIDDDPSVRQVVCYLLASFGLSAGKSSKPSVNATGPSPS
jgi:CheY-like chemotaxis protein